MTPSQPSPTKWHRIFPLPSWLWAGATFILVAFLSYTDARAFLSPNHITYFFIVLGKPFYNVTFTGLTFVIAELVFLSYRRGLRSGVLITAFSLALYDGLNGLIDWNAVHWSAEYLLAISLVYITLLFAPLIAGGFKYNLSNKSLLYTLILFLIWNGVIFPPIYSTYQYEFTLYLIGEPFFLALSLYTSNKILVSRPETVRL